MKKNKSNRYCTNTISFNELIDHLTNNKGGQIKEDLIKMEENPKVHVVGSHGPEENNIHSIHFTYEGAFKEWNVLRINLLKRAKLFIKESKYSKLKRFLRECRRVLKVLRKPGKDEFPTTAKLSAFGLSII